MARDYGIKDVKGRGLQIYTAIDLNAQDTAARTLEAGLAALEKGSRRLRRPGQPLQGAIIHVDVPTGEIRALIGGRNYDLSQFNRALNAKRQVGSLFKPFVYADRVRAEPLESEHHAGHARQRHALRPQAPLLRRLVAAQLRGRLPPDGDGAPRRWSSR